MRRFIFCAVLLGLLTLGAAAKSPDSPIKKKALLKGKVTFTLLGKFESATAGSRQGAAIFGQRLFQAHDGARCDILNIPSGELLKTVSLQPFIAQNHCNNVCFLPSRFFRPDDQFPLLYVSENNLSPFITVNRLASLAGECETVQRIQLPAQIGYYLNAVYDVKKGFIYTVCFKKKTWKTGEDGNCLVVSKVRLPKVSEGNVSLTEVLDQFELPFHKATQGAFFSDGLIVHGFGVNAKCFDGLLIIDPAKKAIVRQIDAHDVFQDEIEGVAPYDGAVLVMLQHGNVFRVDFK